MHTNAPAPSFKHPCAMHTAARVVIVCMLAVAGLGFLGMWISFESPPMLYVGAGTLVLDIVVGVLLLRGRCCRRKNNPILYPPPYAALADGESPPF